MKPILSILIFLFFGLFGVCQESNKSEIDFLANKIKTVYAGYDVHKNGNSFNKLLIDLKRSDIQDTLKLLSEITNFFKDRHLILYDVNIKKNQDTEKCTIIKNNIIQYFKNTKIEKEKYEGFWLSELGNCIMAIKLVSKTPLIYYGYIIESKAKAIPGFIFLKIIKEKDGSFNCDYTHENLGFRIFTQSKFKNEDIFLLNSYSKWNRIKNYKQGYLDSIKKFSFSPKITVLDADNLLIKMPSFAENNIRIYDSLIKVHDIEISRTKNLIIDIRNNFGGTIKNYKPLLKYIYTNPIIHCGGLKLCSDDLIDDLKSDIKDYYVKNDTLSIRKADQKLTSMIANKGHFILIPPDTLISNSTIQQLPANVAIITNNNCLSAAELMILDFKQSKKVKTFGETTGGAVDNLDAIEILLPKTKYHLFIATTKRIITPEAPRYDNKGIKPDIEISDDVTDWVDFVKKYYAN